MTDFVTSVYIGIVIIGALIVAVTAFFIIKSTTRKDIAQTQKQPVESIEASAGQKKVSGINYRPFLVSIIGNITRFFKFRLRPSRLVSIRQRRSVSQDQQAVDHGPTLNEQLPAPLPGVTSSGPEVNAAPSLSSQNVPPIPLVLNEAPGANATSSLPDQETLNAETVVAEPEPNTIPSLPDLEMPNVEPENEELKLDVVNTPPAEPVEFSQNQPEEEPESTEQGESEDLDHTSTNEPQEQPVNEDSVFSLFTDEVVEESSASKFAATLDDVDIQDLLEESKNFLDKLRQHSG